MKSEKGQIILILILVMTVALAIGLSVIQRSLVDVSTSTRVEQSSRAFSAAEAGIERALNIGAAAPFTLTLPESDSQAEVLGSGLIPAVPSTNTRQVPLEYPPLAKEEIAHVWLADLNSTANPPATHYTQNSLDVYWGNSTTDQAALELTLVYHNGTQYVSKKWYLDHASATRTPANNFEQVSCPRDGYSVGSNIYQCNKRIGASPDAPLPSSLPSRLMLLRARLLYNSQSQPFAVWAVGICGTSCSLPLQAREIISRGIAGQTQRTVKLFQLQKVVPPYFDYAIFSAGEISK